MPKRQESWEQNSKKLSIGKTHCTLLDGKYILTQLHNVHQAFYTRRKDSVHDPEYYQNKLWNLELSMGLVNFLYYYHTSLWFLGILILER